MPTLFIERAMRTQLVIARHVRSVDRERGFQSLRGCGDLDHVASFSDTLLRDLPVPSLAPYRNLLAGHAKLCGDHPADAKHTLTLAQKSGSPLIRIAAEYLLSENACLQNP